MGGEQEGEEGSERGSKVLREYLKRRQSDTVAPCYHPIIKIPHKANHCDTSSAGHYITNPYITPIILLHPLSASPCDSKSEPSWWTL